MATAIPERILTLAPECDGELLATVARESGLGVVMTGSVAELLDAIRRSRWLATLVSLGDHVDEALAGRIAREDNVGALLLSAPGASLQRAVFAQRIGAVGLIREPWQEDDLRTRLRALDDEGRAIPLEPLTTPLDGPPELVGSGPAMATVVERIAQVARSRSSLLVMGESGSGKELVARALHWASDRREGPFVAVNCAAIPEHLLESELFGHERGAFTGAVARRTGRIERADGGTLFLDEVGDMSAVLQAKILRVLEERAFERVGGDETLHVDVRFVSATHRDLASAVAEGRFREDLYHRLAVITLVVPPLRERPDDIRELALYFAAHFAERHGREVRAVSEEALRRLEGYEWPGNVRELRNVVDRAVLLTASDVLGTTALRLGEASPSASARPASAASGGYAPSLSLAEIEADHIQRVLTHVDGHMGRAAEILGIHRNTLTRKVRSLGLDRAETG